MAFSPIAIVGRACILPKANTVDELWQKVKDRESMLSQVGADRWRVAQEHILAEDPKDSSDRTWSMQGGYVEGFEDIFDSSGFGIPASDIEGFDPLVHWVLHTIRESLKDGATYSPERTGLVMGNLSFPTSSMSKVAEEHWFPEFQEGETAKGNRFMSGYPALLMRKAFGFQGPCFALDSACASALYAIKLACNALQDGKADVMLAGAVNRADDLFIHVGFSALQALSKSGQSRPFSADADGLIPAEGAGFVVLKRLRTAQRDGDKIFGVIRGIGLSNDGRGRGLLVPSEEGQIRAMEAAYLESGISPLDVQYIECHATGTTVGDGTELKSMSKVFQNQKIIGSLKGNMGHAITVAGVAGLIKVLEAMRHQTLPPQPLIEQENEVLRASKFSVLTEAMEWKGRQLAAVSAFGFGGNNAHLLVESNGQKRLYPETRVLKTPIAIVGMNCAIGSAANREQVWQALKDNVALKGAFGDISFDLSWIKFPPNDLKQNLPQQNILLSLSKDAVEEVKKLENTGVWVGMGTDPEVCRYGARWRVAEWQTEKGLDPQWAKEQRDAIVPLLTAAGVLGSMPNIPANRLNSQFDFKGPSGTISAEEGSGIVALKIAMRALWAKEIDSAIVAAVDCANNPVHQKAVHEVLGRESNTDAGVVLILKRYKDALKDGDEPYAILFDHEEGAVWNSPLIGDSHAAKGLVDVACAMMSIVNGNIRYQVETTDMVGVKHAIGIQTATVGSNVGRKTIAECPEPEKKLVIRGQWTPVQKVTWKEDSKPDVIEHNILPQKVEPKMIQNILGATKIQSKAPRLPSIHTSSPQRIQWQESVAASQKVEAQEQIFYTEAPITEQHSAEKSEVLNVWTTEWNRFSVEHQSFLSNQEQVHQEFLQHQAQMQELLFQVSGELSDELETQEPTFFVEDEAYVSNLVPENPRTEIQVREQVHEVVQTPKNIAPEQKGLSLSREQLLIHSRGNISEIYGELFQPQDQYRVQTRMPEPPLLLADRVTGIDAVPASMKLGTIWTETDVRSDSWWLHVGRMPAGIMIESGQADLMLISYLGIDLLCKGERSYRLLGCELTYHDDLPAVGDTLCYDIHVDGHAKHGDIRLFFFHYDCKINGENRLTVRKGQAGYFSEQDLLESAGVIWTPEEQEIVPNPVRSPPTYALEATTYRRTQVRAFSQGRPWECFGEGLIHTRTHTRTPCIQDVVTNIDPNDCSENRSSYDMLFLQGDVHLDPKGGAWKRGYLRCEVDISPEDWFFEGHFKNDSCMPGTLMFEGCLQAMAFYLTAMGFTNSKDGWRFQPVRNRPYPLLCRGQVTPSSKKLVYEIFVEECGGGDNPFLIADLLCTVDGLKAFHARGMGLELVPDFPITTMQELNEKANEPPCATDRNGFPFDYKAMMASALGRPSDAFGSMYQIFDQGRRVARLPGPPYHFMSRVTLVEGELGRCEIGTTIELEYDVPKDAWYFDRNGYRTMPFCVLLEAALQPCGWLASAVGSVLEETDDLSFRNLDGKGTLHCEVLPSSGIFKTRVKLTNISRSAGMIIEAFDVTCYLGETKVYSLQTVFGFFPEVALKNQVGLPVSPALRAKFASEANIALDLRSQPQKYFQGSLRLADPMICMIDRVTKFEPSGGDKGLGWLRAEKDVDPSEWFFKAHFFQDPVQPGSLGIEAMIQLLQWYMIEIDMAVGMENPRFTSLGLNKKMVWKYRGQVVPENSLISTTIDVQEVGEDEIGRFARANASLWVDGKRIYEAVDLVVHIVPE